MNLIQQRTSYLLLLKNVKPVGFTVTSGAGHEAMFSSRTPAGTHTP